MRSCARSLGRYGVTANCVAIALTATPAVERTLKGDPERLKRTLEKYIIRRPGQPTDIANMVQFLASDASTWITGQVYPVNGGFSFPLWRPPLVLPPASARAFSAFRAQARMPGSA